MVQEKYWRRKSLKGSQLFIAANVNLIIIAFNEINSYDVQKIFLNESMPNFKNLYCLKYFF